MHYIKRQNRLIKLLESRSLDALLIRKRQNISYLAGVRGEDAFLFISKRKKVLITDSRYKEDYAGSVKDCRVRVTKEQDACPCIKDLCKETRSRRIGFEGNNLSYTEYADLKKGLNNIAFTPTRDIVESLRAIKDRDEIGRIRKACKSGCDVMSYGLKAIRPYLSERTLKNRLETYIAKKGLKRADFDIIVASGKNASMPHASPSQKNIKNGEMVVIDLGTMNYGYNSDLTRTVFLGKINRKYLRIYNIVLDAQKKAIEHVRPGIPAKYIDNISRKYIFQKGLGKYFIHSLGHGIGLETHEKPRLSGNSTAILEKDMTITIEPGIYIPAWGGVRIEDIVLVTQDGCEVLTVGCRRELCR